MLDPIFTLSIETEHCLHFANISFNSTVTEIYIYIYIYMYKYTYILHILQT